MAGNGSLIKTWEQMGAYAQAIVLVSALFLVAVIFQPTFASDVPDYSDLKAAIEAAYKARSDLLRHSMGDAQLFIKKEEPIAGIAEKIEKELARDIGRDPEGFQMLGEGQWATTWYQKGLKMRYDINVPPPEKKDPFRKPFLVPRDTRVAVDQEKGMYYSALGKTAYINKPPTEARNPYNLLSYFYIERLYQFNGADVPTLLDRCDEAGIALKISEEWTGNTRCIKLHFKHETVLPGGNIDKGEFSMWVAPEQSYSLIKAQLRGNWAGTKDRLVTVESYEATYQESDKYEGIWLLKEVKVVNNQCHQGAISETLTATFGNVKIGVDIPDETFTFEALGVPPGTMILDKSLRGQPLQYYYKSFPIGKVDDLAEEILILDEKEATDKDLVEAKVIQDNPFDESESKNNLGDKIIERTVANTKSRSFPLALSCVLAVAVVAVLTTVYRSYSASKKG